MSKVQITNSDGVEITYDANGQIEHIAQGKEDDDWFPYFPLFRDIFEDAAWQVEERLKAGWPVDRIASITLHCGYEYGFTPLCYASHWNRLAIMKNLIDYGADLNEGWIDGHHNKSNRQNPTTKNPAKTPNKTPPPT